LRGPTRVRAVALKAAVAWTSSGPLERKELVEFSCFVWLERKELVEFSYFKSG
jgi:hypothetical protein